jgi:hypothetical protein
VKRRLPSLNFADIVQDLFVRLLTAIFTISPGGHGTDNVIRAESRIGASKGSAQKRNLLGSTDVVEILCETLPSMNHILGESDRLVGLVTSISAQIVGPMIRSRLFPRNMSHPVLQLMQIGSKISNASKPWKKDIYDALNDARFFQSPPTIVREGWLPVLGQLSNADKGLLTELSSRLTTPAAAGLMFGVGASAARLDADKKTQLNLRRLAIVVLAAEEDAISIESIRVSSPLRRAIGNGCSSSLRAGVLQNSLSHYLPSPTPFEKLLLTVAVYVDQDGGDTNGDASFFSFIYYKGRSIHASQSFSTKIQLDSVSTHLACNQR